MIKRYRVSVRSTLQLAARYNQLAGIEDRLERLDHAAAENEERIGELTAKAQEYTVQYDYQQLYRQTFNAMRYTSVGTDGRRW